MHQQTGRTLTLYVKLKTLCSTHSLPRLDNKLFNIINTKYSLKVVFYGHIFAFTSCTTTSTPLHTSSLPGMRRRGREPTFRLHPIWFITVGPARPAVRPSHHQGWLRFCKAWGFGTFQLEREPGGWFVFWLGYYRSREVYSVGCTGDQVGEIGICWAADYFGFRWGIS